MMKNLALILLLPVLTLFGGCTFHPELAPAALKQESPTTWTGTILVRRGSK